MCFKNQYGQNIVAVIGCLLLNFACSFIEAQELPASKTEQQIENITENSEDAETEDDSFLQALQDFIKHPLNINTATSAQFKELQILSPIQINNIIQYRELLGSYLSIYELQSVPGLDMETLRRLKPFITAANTSNLMERMQSRWFGGNHTILARTSTLLQRAKGFTKDTTGTRYEGSQQRLLLRYRYNYKNLLQYGIVGEKDAGEQFFKGTQKSGFDYYSAHFFARNLGIVKHLAFGDFTVNFGQGLVQWQNLAFKKSVDVTNIKRQADALRPYNSAGEINFYRGIGVTIEKGNWSSTLFASRKKIDANLVSDTFQFTDDFVSSFQTSGYHRTKSELADKQAQTQTSFGGKVQFEKNALQVSINAVHHQYALPLNKGNEPYNLFALNGNKFTNASLDYAYTYKNFHFFGEAAIKESGAKAMVQGLLMSVANNVDVSLLYRNIAKNYAAVYATAFTESTLPQNESGMYTGISIKASNVLRFDAYADLYSFPWLRFRVDAPSKGKDFLFQATYKPNKEFELYARYRTESKGVNVNNNNPVVSSVQAVPRQNLRVHYSYKFGAITLRNRFEAVWYDRKGDFAENGLLAYLDLIYKPQLSKLSANMRLQYFETDGYNSRLYAFENDVLYSYSIPVFYDKGYKFYSNLSYDIDKKTTLWLRVSQLFQPNREAIGSGLDELPSNKRTEVKLQVQIIL